MSKLSLRLRKQLRKDVIRNTDRKAYERLEKIINSLDGEELVTEFIAQHFDEEFMDKLQNRIDGFVERVNQGDTLRLYSSDLTDICYKNFLLSPLFLREFGKFIQAKEKEAKASQS